MEGKLHDRVIRIFCGTLFALFSFCWLFFFQRELMDMAYRTLFSDYKDVVNLLVHNHLVLSVIVTIILALLAIPGRYIFHFGRGLHSCNYLLSAVSLGIITGFDEHRFFAQTSTTWIVTTLFVVLLPIACLVISSVPKSKYNDRPRTLAGNLLIMSLLFCLIGLMGNTCENTHRSLRMERLYSTGHFEELLAIGMEEEESNEAIDLIRAQAMLSLPTGSNPQGCMIGERLFDYSIFNPQRLSHTLRQLDDSQAYLASCLLEGKRELFTDSIALASYTILPKYYMQALVMSADSVARSLFPQQFANEQALYNQFLTTLEQLSDEPEQFRANSTFEDYHKSYYWYSNFIIKE